MSSKWTFDKIRMHELWLTPTMCDHKRIAFLKDKVATLEKTKKAPIGGAASAKPVVLATKPITAFMGKSGRSEEGEAQSSKKRE